jgi:hypothetical protein
MGQFGVEAALPLGLAGGPEPVEGRRQLAIPQVRDRRYSTQIDPLAKFLLSGSGARRFPGSFYLYFAMRTAISGIA